MNFISLVLSPTHRDYLLVANFLQKKGFLFYVFDPRTNDVGIYNIKDIAIPLLPKGVCIKAILNARQFFDISLIIFIKKYHVSNGGPIKLYKISE